MASIKKATIEVNDEMLKTINELREELADRQADLTFEYNGRMAAEAANDALCDKVRRLEAELVVIKGLVDNIYDDYDPDVPSYIIQKINAIDTGV